MHRTWSRRLPDPQPLLRQAEERALLSGRQLVPQPEDVFRAFRESRRRVRVVIIGQDPYHRVIDGVPQATGRAFAIRDGLPIQPSLREIYRTLPNVPARPRTDLSWWAEQGVFLLNTSLTTEEGVAGAHLDLWHHWTREVCQMLSDREDGLIWCVWGAHAHRLVLETVDAERHWIYTSSHPSPLSSSRPLRGVDYQSGEDRLWPSWRQADMFAQVDALLEEHGCQPIQWTPPSLV